MIQTLFGRKVLLENINNSQVKHVDISKSNRDLISKLKEHHISYQLRDDNFFNSFSKLLNHQGVVISIESNNINNLTSLLDLIKSKSQSIILIIDNLQDPQNFGSILRTCEGMKVDGVIYKKDRQVQINDFVIKTSMGAIQHLNLIKVANLNNAISELKKAGY
jgi:23S rRNA (guanosine2251-2'-O)-methyltransferase